MYEMKEPNSPECKLSMSQHIDQKDRLEIKTPEDTIFPSNPLHNNTLHFILEIQKELRTCSLKITSQADVKLMLRIKHHTAFRSNP